MRGMIFRSRSELTPELVRHDTSDLLQRQEAAAAAGLMSGGRPVAVRELSGAFTDPESLADIEQ